MKNVDYIKIIFTHFLIGIAIYTLPFVSKFYAASIPIIGLFFVIKNKNRNNEVLKVIGYLVGAEVFLRTTNGNPNYEFVRYNLIVFTIIGLFYNGISRKSYPYWILIALLIPSVFTEFSFTGIILRKEIIFNLIGTFCLCLGSIYTYNRKISINELQKILFYTSLPIVTCVSYLLFKCPILDVASSITSTESNYILSGGVAPNQMATILGLGMFIFFLKFFLTPSTNKMFFLNVVICSYIYYRCLLTFSRGGLITGVFLIIVFLVFALLNSKQYLNTNKKVFLTLFCLSTMFTLTSLQTDHLLYKRYADKNPSGLNKSEEINGRKDIAIKEIEIFKENPISGVGTGVTSLMREKQFGRIICSHNEITRLLAENGIAGLLSILLLIIIPVVYFIQNKHNFFILCFFLFWLLTINHSGMRIAAPAFIYALSLLDIDFTKTE